jgi:SAM-dependent methyltransferase
MELRDFVPAANQGGNPALYELENLAVDPRGTVLKRMAQAATWDGRTLLDLGCGSGYWLPGYAAQADQVIGIEPDERLVSLARARDRRVEVLHGSAEHIPLDDASVDVVHARFAYFFPPGCDAGLAEVMRVLKPGGTLVVIDNDLRAGQFAALLNASPWATPQAGGQPTDEWWEQRGAERVEVMSEWLFANREDFEAVLHLEFPADIAAPWLGNHPDALGLTYGYVLFITRK